MVRRNLVRADYHQVELGAGAEGWSMANKARKDPSRKYLATDFKLVNRKRYVAENAKWGVKPFPRNLHFLKGGALTVIHKLKLQGKKTEKIIVAMGTGHLLNPFYLGRIAKHSKEVLAANGVIYFVSTWKPKYFEEKVVPLFEKEGFRFKQLKRNVKRQMEHSSKAADFHIEYGQVQWEYEFRLRK
ncbi:Uncharacterised protein [uncultured archaeon]|nr:Uncharacterised protein [uncultured archaeon]